MTAASRATRLATITTLAAAGSTAYDIARALRCDTSSVKRTARLAGVELPEGSRGRKPYSMAFRAKTAESAPEEPRAVLLLVEDLRIDRGPGRPGLERRRSDCGRLLSCEEDWIEAKGARQAKCPPSCPMWETRR